MKGLKRPAWVVWAAVCAVIARAAFADVALTLDPNVRHQTIEGWGSFLGATDTATRDAFRDLGANVMRMNLPKEVLVASPTDYATPVTLGTDLQADINRMDFDGVQSIQDFASTAQWLSQNALEPTRFKLIGDVWSPPHWMKGPVLDPTTGQPTTSTWIGNPSNDSPAFATPWLSNQYNHWAAPNANDPTPTNQPGDPHFVNYSGDSIGGRLKTEDPATLQQYGLYMAAWVKGWQQKTGVPFTNISLQNESAFQNPFDSMDYTHDASGNLDFTQYAKGLKAVRDAFAANGITTPIRGPHMNGVGDSPSNPWRTWLQVGMINGVKTDADRSLINALSSYTSNYYVGYDDTAVRMIAAYWHGNNNVPPPPGQTWAGWDNNPNGLAGDGKENWYVETGDGGPGWTSNADGSPGAITVALKMHNALAFSDASAYLYWQFVDGTGSPSQYGLLGDGQQSDPTQSKKYDAFKQFSRFIRPGAVRIDANFTLTGNSSYGGADSYDTLHGVDVTAYVNDADHTATLVLLNLTGSDQTLSINLGGLSVADWQVYRTSDTENFAQLADLLANGGNVTLTIPNNSVTTLTGATPEPAALGLLAVGTLLLLRQARN